MPAIFRKKYGRLFRCARLDNIPHDKLMELVRERIADGRVLKLIESFLKTGAMEMGEIEAQEQEAGTP